MKLAKKTFLAALSSIVILSSLAFLPAQKVDALRTRPGKVTICHHVPGIPYNQITVAPDAVDGVGRDDHNKNRHQGGNDIIPPGPWDIDGRNWDAAGQAIWRNGCNVPESTPSPTPRPTRTPKPTPTPSSTPEPEEELSMTLALSGPACGSTRFDVTSTITSLGDPIANWPVQFTYKGNVVGAQTDTNGQATAGFDFQGDDGVTVEADNVVAQVAWAAYPNGCPDGGGKTGGTEVLGASTEVLGASTLASTGKAIDQLITSLFVVGSGLVVAGLKKYGLLIIKKAA